MALTDAQLIVVRNDVINSADPAVVAARGGGNVGRDDTTLSAIYSADASPAWYVWRIETPTTEIAAAINLANFTPADTPDGTLLFSNRCDVCALKRDNLRMLLDRDSLPTAKLNTRQSLADALQNVPAGAGGALLDAGWLGADKVKAVITRTVSRVERLFSTGTGTAAVPGVLVYEGEVTPNEIGRAFQL